jgi:hypothetical protein
MKILSITILALLISFTNSQAQLAIAVAKNENGSSVKYSLKQGKSIEEAASLAKKELEDLEYKDIMVLKSDEKTGHELTKGFYVLLISSRKDYSGKLFVSYGLGASANSKQEAIERAVIHMKEFDWGYDIKFGNAVEKEGMIEKFSERDDKEDKK